MTDSPGEDTAGNPGRLTVLVVGPHADARGGIGSVQWVLEQYMREPAAEVELVTVCTHRDGRVARRLCAMTGGMLVALARIVARPPAVVHLHMSQRLSAWRKGLLVAVARRRGVATVLHVHGSEFLSWFDALPAPARAVLRRFLRPDRLVVLSSGLAEEYAARLDLAPDAPVVLPNPVAWPATVPERAADDAPVTAAFLGRFGPRKGVDDLVAAVALLDPAVRARLQVVAAGDGDAEHLRALVTGAGVDDTVEVRGWIGRDERDALLARAGLLVLPSSHEGLPMAVLEAMAWGVVPVVTPVGGLPEVVVDGVNGVHVPVGDPPALAAALAGLVGDPARRAELGDRARADVAALSSERWGRRLGEVWAETAA